MNLETMLLAAAGVFAIGCFGLLARRRPMGMVVGAQLMGLGVVLALLAFDRFQAGPRPGRGEGFAVLVAVVGVAQMGIGLALGQLVSPEGDEQGDERFEP